MSDWKLVFIVLNRDEYLEEVLEGFVELDVRGATVIDSVGMGQLIAHAAPVFGGISRLVTGARPYNKTIFTVVEAAKIEAIVKVYEQICGSLDDPGAGLIFTVPVDFVKGLSGEALA